MLFVVVVDVVGGGIALKSLFAVGVGCVVARVAGCVRCCCCLCLWLVLVAVVG